MKLAAIGGAGLLTVSAAVAGALPANAVAAPKWRVVEVKHHSGGSSSYNGVVATGKNNAWVFGAAHTDKGERALARHWTGRAWRTVALPASVDRGAHAASASSASNVWALAGSWDGDPSYALRWNGRKWSVSKKWTGGLASDILTTGPKDVWVFGYSRAGQGIGTWHYNGKKWARAKVGRLLPSQGSIVSKRDIWAVGATQNTGCGDRTVAHFNGKSWKGIAVGKALPPDIPQSTEGGPYQCVLLSDVVAPSSKSVWVVGRVYRSDGKEHSETQPLLLHWNGKTWQRKYIPGGWDPRRLASDGHGGLWVSGSKSAGDPPVDSTPLLHRAANGGWTTAGFTKKNAAIYDLTLIPGTRSLWGVGRIETTTNDAAIYHS